jgi:hypothetical protein
LGVRRVVVCVDRIVFSGGSATDSASFVKGLRAELGRRLAVPEVAKAMAARKNHPTLRTSAATESRTVGFERAGAMVARRITETAKS